MEKTKILTIDDNDHIRNLIKKQLEILDPTFEVETANNGKDGIKKAKKFQPQVILLDIEMPKMSGFEVLETLKKEEATSTIPVIMLSGIEDENARYKTAGLYHEEYLSKPINDKKLKETIDRVLARTSSS